MSGRSHSPVRCADLRPARVSWLWYPYLPRGKLAVLDGDPGTGKSFATIDLAARLSGVAPWPDDSKTIAGPASVLLLSAEDDANDTIQPRLAAAGANLERVHVLAAAGLGSGDLLQIPRDLANLHALIREREAALVVIDPMMAFFPPEVSANSDQAIRTALTPLASVAATTGATILLVRHLRKAGGASAIYRGAGSIGIMGAVRTGLMIALHPDDPDLRVLAMTKTNIGPLGRSLGFRLATNAANGQTTLEWTGPLDLGADDLCGGGPPTRAGQRTRGRAAEWLREFLANGPRRSTEVYEAARLAGFADRTLNRAKEAVGVRSEAIKQGEQLEWWWHDPVVPCIHDVGHSLRE